MNRVFVIALQLTSIVLNEKLDVNTRISRLGEEFLLPLKWS